MSITLSTNLIDSRACWPHLRRLMLRGCTCCSSLHVLRPWLLWLVDFCLQWIDAVGWAARRHPACKKTELWGAGMVICLEVQTCIWPSWCHCHSLSLASVKSRLVLPFRYQLTRVVPDKGPLNWCTCVRMLKVIGWTVLQAHGRMHDAEARRRAMCVCPVCGKQLSKSTNLHKHLRLHVPRPPP